MGSMVSNSVAQPVQGGSTGGGGLLGLGGFFGKMIQQAVDQGVISPVNQQPVTSTPLPVTNQNPTVNMTGGRFNQVRDPRLNRVASRPMFRTSRYDSQISDLLNRLMPQTENKANGGRIGYADGSGPIPLGLVDYRGTPWENSFKLASQPVERKMGLLFNPDGSYPGENMSSPIQALPRPGQYETSSGGMGSLIQQNPNMFQQTQQQARTVSANPVNDLYKYYLENGTDEEYKKKIMDKVNLLFGIKKAHGGMMNHPIRRLKGGISELDLRAKGGFIPIGVKEKADDVPAMLSKNEFVFTADAVRNAGGGSINKGAQKMYKLMKSLENKKVNRKAN